MGARIIPFFEKVTETFSYLVMDSSNARRRDHRSGARL